MQHASRRLLVEAGPADREGHRAPARRADVQEFKAEPCSVNAAAPAGAKPGSFESGTPLLATLRRGLAAPGACAQLVGASLPAAPAFALAFAPAPLPPPPPLALALGPAVRSSR